MQRIAIFEEQGHFTAMHNALFDTVQPRLSLSAWSVLCVIVRRTKGWGKRFDALSYEQIKAATGLKSSATIAKALAELLSPELFGRPLVRQQKSAERAVSRREATRYALNPRFEIEVPLPEAETEGAEAQLHSASPDLRRGNPCGCPLATPGLPESEVPMVFHLPENEAPTPVRPSENEHTKEKLYSSKVKSSKCERTRAPVSSSSAPSFSKPENSTSSQVTPLFHAVCAATMRDPTIVSPRMRQQLLSCAQTLERAGYTPENIERAAAMWPHPTAPYPSQLLDNIQSLLNARPLRHDASPSSRATDSNRASVHPTPTSPRPFESAAERKGRKWAQWLTDIGDA